MLLPQSSFRIFAGYSRNSQTGPALSTINLFDQHRGDEFPLFTDVRRLQDEYRLGAEMQLLGPQALCPARVGAFPGRHADTSGFADREQHDQTRATHLIPARTSLITAAPGIGASIFITEHAKWYSLNGRFTYAGTRRNFIFDEAALGTDRFGAARNRQVFLSGEWTGGPFWRRASRQR